MKRIISLLLAVALLGVVSGVLAQSPQQNSGFRTGHVSSADDLWEGALPAGAVIVKVTAVTSTTVFYIEAIKGLTSGSTTTLAQIDSLYPGNFKFRGASCFTTANEGFEVEITAYVMGSGKVTTSAWGTALTKGDYLFLMPITGGGDPTADAIYIRLDTGDYSATNAWDDVGFNRILTVTGLVRVRIIPEIVTGLAGGTNISLGSVGNTASMRALTAVGLLDTGHIWLSGIQSLTDAPWLGGALPNNTDFIVNGVNIGHTVTGSELTAGNIIYHIWVTSLSPNSGAVAGAGEAN